MSGKLTKLSLREAMATLPLRSRLSLQLKFFWWDVRARIPGYHAISWACVKVRRQGISALWEPPFNIYKEDRTAFDVRLRWHGWGVLREPSGYRGYTPTRRTAETFLDLAYVWSALEAAYRGGANDWAWEPLGSRKDGSSPQTDHPHDQ